MLEKLERLADLGSKAMLWLAGLAIVMLMLHVSADVLGKLIFSQPVFGTLEIVANYYMVACVFLPISFVQARRQHLMVELFTINLSNRLRAGFDAFAGCLALIYVTLLAWLVLNKALISTERNELIRILGHDIPAWPSRWFLPASFGFLAIVLAIQIIGDLRKVLSDNNSGSNWSSPRAEAGPGVQDPDVRSR